MLHAERAGAFEEPVHGGAVEAPRLPPFAIRLGDACEQLQVHFVREPAERAVANFVAPFVPGARLEMLRGDAGDLRSYIVAVE